MGGTIACLAVLENQENLSGLILESAAIELHPKTASWTVRTAAKILSKEGFQGQLVRSPDTLRTWRPAQMRALTGPKSSPCPANSGQNE